LVLAFIGPWILALSIPSCVATAPDVAVTIVIMATLTLMSIFSQPFAAAPGIIPRCIKTILEMIATDPAEQAWSHKLTLSYLEIYNEKVYDLLEPKENDLPSKRNAPVWAHQWPA